MVFFPACLQSPKARRAGQPTNGRAANGSGNMELTAVVIARDEAVVLDGGRQSNGSIERKSSAVSANGFWH